MNVIIAYLTIVSIDLNRPEERQMRGKYCSKSVKHSLGKKHPEPTNQSQTKKKKRKKKFPPSGTKDRRKLT